MNVTRSFVLAATLLWPLYGAGAHRLSAFAAHQPDSMPSMHTSTSSPSLVDKVRLATDIYRDINQTTGTEYGAALGCVSGPVEGAMGVHFVNPTLLTDGALDASRPEALIYEFSNGRARLVGVEFMVLAADWLKTHAENDPPILEGQLLEFVDSPNRFGLPAFYELHVWAWRDNPNGMFVDWNPHVSCEG